MGEDFLKFYLETTLGKLGAFLYRVLQLLILASMFAPFLFFSGPIWIYIILIIILLIPGIGSWMEFILYCMTFTYAIAEPVSTKVIIYYVALGIYVLTGIIPTIISLISLIIEKIAYRK